MRALTVCVLVSIITYSAFAQSTPTVWVYRPAADNSGMPLTLYMDGHKLATMAEGQFLGIRVPVGSHSFSWTSAPSAAPVVVPISAQAYLEVRFGTAHPFLVVTQPELEKAIAAMDGLQPVDAAAVFDFGVIVPAQTLTASAKGAPAAVVKASQPRPALAPPVSESIASANAPTTTLANIQKIYIDDLGRGEGSDVLREKIQQRLLKDGHFIVVEKPELAEAVLTGEAGVRRIHSGSSFAKGLFSSGGTSSRSNCALRLVATQSNETVWSLEYKPRFSSFGVSAAHMANQVVDKLMKDAVSQAKRK